jgi:hypothetical protein
MTLIRKILSRNEFREQPPVLLDVGASGSIHPKWTAIAPYSVCIAFDADNREMGYVVRESSGYLKLYVYNHIDGFAGFRNRILLNPFTILFQCPETKGR